LTGATPEIVGQGSQDQKRPGFAGTDGTAGGYAHHRPLMTTANRSGWFIPDPPGASAGWGGSHQGGRSGNPGGPEALREKYRRHDFTGQTPARAYFEGHRKKWRLESFEG